MLPHWYYELPRELIEERADAHGVDAYLLAAICQHESLGVTYRTRYDSSTPIWMLHKPELFSDRLSISQATEALAQMHAYGVPQVPGWRARAQGFGGHLVELCAEPEIALEHAAIYLRYLLDGYEDEDAAISAYRTGFAPKTPDGRFKNERDYVAPVLYWLEELRRASH